MMRIKNEERWIGRNLERTWQVASKVVLWDDGSTDHTEVAALASLPANPKLDTLAGAKLLYESMSAERLVRWLPESGWIAKATLPWGEAELHFLKSPYTGMVRPKMRRNELRDKNCLWWYVKSAIDFDYVLCLDGDEVLSKKALAAFPEMWVWFENQTCDWISFPFIYLWNTEDQRRVDAIYGDRPEDGSPHLRFPRFFSIKRLDEQQLYDTRFNWLGTRGGLHCGSIPQEAFHQIKPKQLHARYAYVLHYGYLDRDMRVAKFQMYNTIDPGNKFEGFYSHLIEEPNQHAPGPVQFVPWSDEP